jgi:hypothetical protein
LPNFQHFGLKLFKFLRLSCAPGGTMVIKSTYYPKIRGSNPATGT